MRVPVVVLGVEPDELEQVADGAASRPGASRPSAAGTVPRRSCRRCAAGSATSRGPGRSSASRAASGASAALDRCVMSRPWNTIRPAVGSISRVSSRPVVVLPQPDSPTIPKVSPAATLRSSPSTARTVPTERRRTPRRTGKCFSRPVTDSSGSALTGGARSRRSTAPGARRGRGGRRRGGPRRRPSVSDGTWVAAQPAGARLVRAAGVERAPGRDVDQARRRTLHGREAVAPVAVQARHGAEQAPGVGMLRPTEQVLRAAVLHRAARVHDEDVVGELGDDPQVVGDQDDGGVELLLQTADQVEDLRLDGDVERRGRLVGDEQLGVAGQRHRDHRPLPHAPRRTGAGSRPPARPGAGCRRGRAGRRRACARRPSRPCGAPGRPR